MKQKLVATILSAAMVGTLLAGCGSTKTSSSSAASSAASSSSSTAAASSSSSEAVASSSAAASSSSSSDAGTAQFDGLKANKAYKFSVIVKSFQSTYWQAAIKGMDKAKDELGVTYEAQGPNSESDIADQVNMLNSAINSKPDGIALAACDTSSVLDSLQTAKDAGVPVVAFDTGIADAPDGSIACTVATDCVAAGQVAADKMYAALKDRIAKADGQVRIGEINQDATALNIQQRGIGFIDEIIKLAKADGKTVAVTGNDYYVNNCTDKGEESSADIVIEVAVPAQTTVDLCSTEAATILNKDDTIGIFGSNQTSAEGLLAANDNLQVLGSDDKSVVGIGFDAGSTIKAAVQDGTLLGAVTQSPLMMGYYAIYALTAAANGTTLEDVPTAGYWYDASNMTDDNIAPNLYD